MLEIQNLSVKLEETDDEVLKNISLSIGEGEVHYLTGRNGSGKSSLLQTIMGHSDYNISSGSIRYNFNDKEIDLATIGITERSLQGIFLANQTPVEVPGVPLRQFLRLIYNSRLEESEKLPVFKFRKVLLDICNNIDYPIELLN